MWVVHPDLRHVAAAMTLMQRLEDEFDATCSLGVSRPVVHRYTRRGYLYAEALCRWVLPLDTEGFDHLTGMPPAAQPLGRPPAQHHLERFLNHPARAVTPLAAPDLQALETVYARTAAQVLRVGLHRTAAFWTWRYLDCPIYDYLFFGETDVGFVVGRIEHARDPEGAADGLGVLRLIELLPAARDAWFGVPDPRFGALLAGVLHWARRAGCVLADFQHVNDRLSPTLQALGFALQAESRDPALRAVPHLFQPLRRDIPPINLVLRAQRNAEPRRGLNLRDVYAVKSDGGMDRPHAWPLPAARAPDRAAELVPC